MEQYFNTNENCTITMANRSKYAIPTMHPNRIMREFDFIYMVDGEWKIGQEAEQFHMRTDDVLILCANRHHYGIEPCLPGTKTMYIHAFCAQEDLARQSMDAGWMMLRSHIRADMNPDVKKCFEKIIFSKSWGDQRMASAYFRALLCELNRCMHQTNQNTIAEQMRQMIVSSSKLLKNNEIANAFGISVKTAETMFKSTFHTTIHRYVIDTKIDQTKFHLVNFPDMKLAEIAVNLGFYDEFHLSRQFKKHTGQSPGAYRKQHIR